MPNPLVVPESNWELLWNASRKEGNAGGAKYRLPSTHRICSSNRVSERRREKEGCFRKNVGCVSPEIFRKSKRCSEATGMNRATPGQCECPRSFAENLRFDQIGALSSDATKATLCNVAADYFRSSCSSARSSSPEQNRAFSYWTPVCRIVG